MILIHDVWSAGRLMDLFVYISHVLIMVCPLNISMNMDTVNCFWKKFLCIRFSPNAILLYCWSSEYGFCVSTPGPQNLSIFSSNLLLSSVTTFNQNVSAVWQSCWQNTPQWWGLIVRHKGQSVSNTSISQILTWCV
jgi:hypothetical protein